MIIESFNQNFFQLDFFSSWWFQPIWKTLVKLDHFPRFRGENKKIFETTTQFYIKSPMVSSKTIEPTPNGLLIIGPIHI